MVQIAWDTLHSPLDRREEKEGEEREGEACHREASSPLHHFLFLPLPGLIHLAVVVKVFALIVLVFVYLLY
jgi:hypothetical protein